MTDRWTAMKRCGCERCRGEYVRNGGVNTEFIAVVYASFTVADEKNIELQAEKDGLFKRTVGQIEQVSKPHPLTSAVPYDQALDEDDGWGFPNPPEGWDSA